MACESRQQSLNASDWQLAILLFNHRFSVSGIIGQMSKRTFLLWFLCLVQHVDKLEYPVDNPEKKSPQEDMNKKRSIL